MLLFFRSLNVSYDKVRKNIIFYVVNIENIVSLNTSGGNSKIFS